MSNLSKLLGAFILILFSAASQAQNYYVCDTGNDANTGKSETQPFKTHTKAMSLFSKLYAGDNILYCRGGKFYADTFSRIANTKCGPQNVCTIGDYGSETEPKPIIYAVGQTPFNFQNGGDSKPDGGYVLKNIDLIAIEKSGSGIMLYNDVDDLVIDNVQIEGFNVGVYSAGANNPSSGNQANDRIVLKNSKIMNNKKQGWLGGCNDCLIENNHFENNGSLAVFDHNIYIDSPIKKQTFYNRGITVRGNTLTKSNMVDGKCSGTSLVVHGIIKDLVIDNNLIKEEVGKVSDHCWGIGVDPGNSLDESFVGVTITNNKLLNVGNTGIGCASCVNTLISNNTIIDEGNILRSGISVPDKKSEDSTKSNNLTIEKNKIILNHELGYGMNLGGSNQFVVRNNDISTNELQSRSRCFELKDGNINTDVSMNSCGTHTSVSINDANLTNEPVELEESTPVDVGNNEELDNQQGTENVLPAEEDTQVVDVNPIDETQSDETNFEIVQPTDTVSAETPIETSPDNSDTINTDSSGIVDTTTSQMRTNNRNQGNLKTVETETDPTSSTGSKPRRASGGSSGGSSTKSSGETSISSVSEDESISDGVAFFETIQPATNSSYNTEISDTTITESKTIQNSSPSITKMRDVIQAKQENLSNLDPSQCRASANGKCLMK